MLSPEGAAAENLCGIPAGQGRSGLTQWSANAEKPRTGAMKTKASRRILKETGEI